MPKTVPPGVVEVPNVGRFVANAVPDPFDERDFPYQPRLQPLPPSLDERTLNNRNVMTQEGNSCTGHAIAAVINTVLGNPTSPGGAQRAQVSPYMLYRLARRYDEFEGDEDVGSSLRGALKGWFHHGLALAEHWDRLDVDPEPDLEDPDFIAKCRDRPLGAFYRVNAYRLDDMQSAISELHAIAVSGVIHEGWQEPVTVTRNGETVCLINPPVNRRSLGGHAFALVGYNRVGFLVQNSWGSEWGKDGFATISYEDWLDSAYDAWVVRPGVPHTPFADGRPRDVEITGGRMGTGRGVDLRRLERHVVNLGNAGRLSTSGTFVSTPAQMERIFERMEEWHDFWTGTDPGLHRHVVLYAHGGLVSEAAGLETAQKHVNWWLNNRVYPIYFAWQSGPAETLLNQLVDLIKEKLPFGGLGFDLVEQFDRLVEKIARSSVRWMWDEMKENARGASDKQGGATLTVARLKRYIQAHRAANVRVHLVGHSAGSIFLTPLIQRLAEARIAVDSMALLAPAIRVDEFARELLPHIGNGKTVSRFTTFAMSDQRELDDVCASGGIAVYQKSLLYLVSRALELADARADVGDRGGEVRLLGMEKFFDRPLARGAGRTLRQAIERAGGQCVFSRSAAPPGSRSDADSHGGFDDDSATLTSVVMRMLRAARAEDVEDYVRNAALRHVPGMPAATAPAPAPAPRTRGAPAEPAVLAAAVRPAGAAPVVEAAEPQLQRPVAPAAADTRLVPEVAVAPFSGSAVLDALRSDGWDLAARSGNGGKRGGTTRSARKRSPAGRKR